MKVFTSVMLDMRGEVKNIFWGSGSACCVCLHENLSLRKYMLQNSNEQRFFSPHINLKSKFKHAPALMKISCLKKVITRYTFEARDFYWLLHGGSDKEPTCQRKRHKKIWVRSLGQEDPLEEATLPHYSCLANPHGQRSLVGCSPQRHSQSQLSNLAHTQLKHPSQWQDRWKTFDGIHGQRFCDPMDSSLPGFSVHEIFQARIMGWVVIPFSRASSQPRDWTWVSCFASRFLTV